MINGHIFTHAFTAVLALFLLDMGLTAAGSLRPLPWQHWRVVLFALLIPVPLATIGLLVGVLVLQLPAGSAVILTALVASASYIAAPAAVRTAIPDANIGLAMLAALGLGAEALIQVAAPAFRDELAESLG